MKERHREILYDCVLLCNPLMMNVIIMYGIMTNYKELIICELRIDEATGQGDSDSRMTSFEVIMPLELQSTKMLMFDI